MGEINLITMGICLFGRSFQFLTPMFNIYNRWTVAMLDKQVVWFTINAICDLTTSSLTTPRLHGRDSTITLAWDYGRKPRVPFDSDSKKQNGGLKTSPIVALSTCREIVENSPFTLGPIGLHCQKRGMRCIIWLYERCRHNGAGWASGYEGGNGFANRHSNIKREKSKSKIIITKNTLVTHLWHFILSSAVASIYEVHVF